METLRLSPNCPLALQQGTYETQYPFSRVVADLVVYHKADDQALEAVRAQADYYNTGEFTQQHNSRLLSAARNCARTIERGECPFWLFDENQHRLVSAIESAWDH